MDHFYQNIPGPPSSGDHFDFRVFYAAVAAACPQKVRTVEVGVFKGQSLAYLVVEAINNGKEVRAYGVDRFTVFKASGRTHDDFYRDAAGHLASLTDEGHVHLIRKASVEAAPMFGTRAADFVFLDADHDYDSVKADLEAWEPVCRGLIAGHDYNQGGVMRAVRDHFGGLAVTFPVGTHQRACWAVNIGEVEWAYAALRHVMRKEESVA